MSSKEERQVREVLRLLSWSRAARRGPTGLAKRYVRGMAYGRLGVWLRRLGL